MLKEYQHQLKQVLRHQQLKCIGTGGISALVVDMAKKRYVVEFLPYNAETNS